MRALGEVCERDSRLKALTHPGGSDVHHNLLEGGCIFGLPLNLDRDFLAEFSRVAA